MTITQVRPVTKEEWDRLQAAILVTRRFRPARMFADLSEAYARVLETITQTQTEVAADHSLPEDRVRRLESAVREWLAQFRAFDDHSRRAIGRYFPGDATLKEGVKAAFSHEYDANLAYRLACALRNVSQHEGRVVNGTRLTIRDTEPSVDFFLGFDCPRLAAEHNELPARVRRELSGIPQPLALPSVVEATMIACERIMGRVLRLVHDRVLEEASFIEALHEEAVSTDEEDSGLVAVQEDEEGNLHTLERTHIPHGVRAALVESHQEALALLAHEWHVTVEDLAEKRQSL